MEAIQVHRWTREEYERMADHGILAPDARVELIDGEIIERSPQKSLHATAIRLTEEALRSAFGTGFDIRAQFPLAMGETSMPEPDVAVVPGSPRDYRDAHPTEAVLVVEVSESTLAFDRGTKLRLYARNGVPEYWIVNLQDFCVEMYRDPSGEVYRSKSTYGASAHVAPLARPEAQIAVADLLP